MVVFVFHRCHIHFRIGFSFARCRGWYFRLICFHTRLSDNVRIYMVLLLMLWHVSVYLVQFWCFHFGIFLNSHDVVCLVFTFSARLFCSGACYFVVRHVNVIVCIYVYIYIYIYIYIYEQRSKY